jgi:pyrimidine operon attenuation protein/uracil phosphoribosyltransferase
MRTLLDVDAVTRGLRRVAGEIVERHGGAKNLVLIAIRRGGIPVAAAIKQWIEELEGQTIEVGTVDITLYRDDAATALPNPRIGRSDIPFTLEGRRVVLVDDVAYTRRTIRAALEAVLDYGRPKLIELAVLIDRAGRELPIQPDYSVVRVETIGANERIDVLSDELGLRAVVQPMSAPSIPPATP